MTRALAFAALRGIAVFGPPAPPLRWRSTEWTAVEDAVHLACDQAGIPHLSSDRSGADRLARVPETMRAAIFRTAEDMHERWRRTEAFAAALVAFVQTLAALLYAGTAVALSALAWICAEDGRPILATGGLFATTTLVLVSAWLGYRLRQRSVPCWEDLAYKNPST